MGCKSSKDGQQPGAKKGGKGASTPEKIVSSNLQAKETKNL